MQAVPVSAKNSASSAASSLSVAARNSGRIEIGAEEPTVRAALYVTRQPDAGRSRVREKQRVVRSQLAERRGQEFRPDRLDPRPFLDIVLQELMERGCVRDMLL